jgi:CzcA family heavy metal efflux pump
MLSLLIRFSIRYAGVVLVLAVVLLAYGGYRFAGAGLDIFPEFAPKRVVIQTEAAGLAAEQVEVLVTQPLETGISSLMGLIDLRSESIQGLSIITATFADDSDSYRNRQLVGERLSSLMARLPPGSAMPVMVPLSSSSATVLTLGMQSDSKSLMELRSWADWTLVPRLLAIPGVADVNVFGGEVQQLQIQFKPEALLRLNLSVDDVINAAKGAADYRGAGFIENSNQRFTLQVLGQPASPEQFKQLVVKRQGASSVQLGDVADIAYAPEPAISAAQIMGKSGIVLMVIGQLDANTLSVSRQVEAVLEEMQPIVAQQAIQLSPHLFRPADYIERSLANVSSHLLVGGVLVLVVLYLFLYNFRCAVIAGVAIPVSLMAAVLVLLESGVHLNIMVLGGLAIALGEVVDDAIIDTENIVRRLRLNQQQPQPAPVDAVIFQASMEVRGSVVYASFIVALVFLPLLTLSGVTGRLFSPLGYSYSLAILMSLAVALTLTPALCRLLLHKTLSDSVDTPLLRRLKPGYERLLAAVMRHFVPVAWLCAALCAAGMVAITTVDHQFLPELREGHFIVHTASVPGTSLEESLRVGQALTRQFLAIDGVESVSQWAGRAERGADTYGSHYSEYEVRLKPIAGDAQQQVLAQLRAILADFPGIQSEANSFLIERVDETIAGYTAAVVVNIVGQDLALLDQQAQAVAGVLASVPGATDVQVRSAPATAMVQIVMDLEQMAFKGLRPEQVMAVIQTAYEGQWVGKQLQGNRQIDVVVALPPEQRRHIDTLKQLPLINATGQRVVLEQVASIQQVEGRYNILHHGAQRLQTVTCNVAFGDLDAFIQQAKQRVLTEIDWRAGGYPNFVGAAIEQTKSRNALMMHASLATIGVLILIAMALGSVRHTLLTLVNLPFALVGGVAVVVLSGADLSVGSFVGFVTLFGISVRNCIMLIAHYRHLISHEGLQWSQATAMRGAEERLPAIVMTALVTALAMLPIALDSDNPGREIMGPMAAIICGGLASSTLLNLLLLPVILLRYGRFDRAV